MHKMERSQSCVDLKMANSVLHTASIAPRDAQQQHEPKAQKLQQQQHQQQFNDSRDNFPMVLCLAQQQQQQQQHQPNLPPNKPLRRRKLQRQPSAVDHDDYAADVEEDANEHELIARLKRQQQQQYQLQQQQQHHMQLKRQVSICSTSNSSGTLSTSVSTPSTPTRRRLTTEESFESIASLPSPMTTAAAELSPLLQRHQLHRQQHYQQHQHQHQQHYSALLRDNSVQSDSSRYSSVDSLLESRKPDPEAILINLGFGPVGSEDILSRIPKRFLKPSQVRGINTEAFVKRLQLASSLAESSVMGFRGLTGNPDMPPSSIVAKIMQRFEVNQRKKSMDLVEHTIR